ncbi:MAG: DUF2752 domain-containing protein [Bacteroidota bacterium]
MKLIQSYLKKNWILYTLLLVYILSLFGNSLGIHLWLPSCPISAVTGYECFGCGLNRAAIALLSGDFAAALSYNPLIFIYLPLITGWITYDFYKFYLKHKTSNYEIPNKTKV